MKKLLTRSQERMHSETDWLDSFHSFSFGGHYDPGRMGFGPLRVVNDDIIAPGKGFGMHPHRDMEIISLVLEGQLEHKDSMGNGRVIQTGDIQYMSAGTGVQHSEFNPSDTVPVHLMQIWIEPYEKGMAPRYADQPILGKVDNEWKLLLSPDGRDGSMEIRQDAELRSLQLGAGKCIGYATANRGRGFWLFVMEGEIEVAGEHLKKGDSLALSGISDLEMSTVGPENANLLLFDLPV